MQIEAFYDEPTSTLTYVVYDAATKDAVVIDPVLDFDPLQVSTSTRSAQAVLDFLEAHGLKLHWILETHAHADHLSGSQFLKEKTGAGVAIGEHIQHVQEVFKGVFDLGDDFATDGSQFDRLVSDGEVVEAGALSLRVLHTPGHTPACVSYLVGDAVFTGDAMFMPDFGTGRCDFPGGSAEALYASVTGKLYTLPDATRVFVGHDYQPGGRELAYETTIGECKRSNKQLRADTPEEQFVTWRAERDATLSLPKLIFQSVQVNIAAGHLPEPEGNGIPYLKLPLNQF